MAGARAGHTEGRRGKGVCPTGAETMFVHGMGGFHCEGVPGNPPLIYHQAQESSSMALDKAKQRRNRTLGQGQKKRESKTGTFLPKFLL